MIAVFGAGVLAAQAALITTTITNTANAEQGEIRYYPTNAPANGTAYGSSFGTNSLTTGQLSAGESTKSTLARSVVKFNYADSLLAGGDTLQSATLRLFITGNNLPAAGNGTAMQVWGDANAPAGSYTTNDFASAAFDTYIGSYAGQVGTYPTNNWLEINVTALVSNAFTAANGGTITTSFRLQLLNDMLLTYNSSPITDLGFTDNSVIGGNIPQLVITTIPEPATIGMIGLGALITLLFRRFRVS